MDTLKRQLITLFMIKSNEISINMIILSILSIFLFDKILIMMPYILSLIKKYNTPTIIQQPTDKKKKVTARKPNENQKATKYSIPNMVWFLRNETRENLEKDKRFMKDLKRYYKDFDEFTTIYNEKL